MSRDERDFTDAGDYAGRAAAKDPHRLRVMPGNLSCSCGGWEQSHGIGPLDEAERDAILRSYVAHLEVSG